MMIIGFLLLYILGTIVVACLYKYICSPFNGDPDFGETWKSAFIKAAFGMACAGAFFGSLLAIFHFFF